MREARPRDGGDGTEYAGGVSRCLRPHADLTGGADRGRRGHPPVDEGARRLPELVHLGGLLLGQDLRVQGERRGPGQLALLLVLPGLQKRQIRLDASIWPSPEGSGSAPTPRGRLGSPRSKFLEISTCHPSPERRFLTNLSAVRAGMDHLLFFFSKQERSCPETKGGKLPLTQACPSES